MPTVKVRHKKVSLSRHRPHFSTLRSIRSSSGDVKEQLSPVKPFLWRGVNETIGPGAPTTRSPPSWNGMTSLGRCCANTTLYVTQECIGTNSSIKKNLKKKCLTHFGARLTWSSMRTSWKMYATPLKVANTSLLFQTFLISLTSHLQLDVSKTYRGHGRSLALKDRTRVWIERTKNGEQMQ